MNFSTWNPMKKREADFSHLAEEFGLKLISKADQYAGTVSMKGNLNWSLGDILTLEGDFRGHHIVIRDHIGSLGWGRTYINIDGKNRSNLLSLLFYCMAGTLVPVSFISNKLGKLK